MSVFRRPEKASLARRVADAATSLGVLVLIVGLVGAFLVAGVYAVHAALARGEGSSATSAAPPPPAAAKQPLPFAAPPPPSVPDPVPVPVPVTPPRPLAKPADPTRIDEEGFIKYWLVLAPIPSEKEMAGGAEISAERLPDEARLRPRADERVKVKGKDLVWKRFRSSDFAIDFKKAVEGERGEDAVAYAVCYVHAPEERKDVKLFVGTNDQGKVWLNGQAVFAHEKSRTLKKDNDVVSGLTLRQGENVVLLKVANERGNWQGCLRFGDASGTPMVDLHVTSTPR